MNFDAFIREMILGLNESEYIELKNRLSGKFLHFYVVDNENVTKELLAEKLCDYLEVMNALTGKEYDKNLKAVFSNLISVISPYIEEKTRVDKYLKYVEKSCKNKAMSFDNDIDTMRILLTVYSSVIKNKHEKISDFDFSVSSLNIDAIINALESEESKTVDLGPLKSKPKKRFDSRKEYSMDAFTFMNVLMFYYYLKTNDVSEEE